MLERLFQFHQSFVCDASLSRMHSKLTDKLLDTDPQSSCYLLIVPPHTRITSICYMLNKDSSSSANSHTCLLALISSTLVRVGRYIMTSPTHHPDIPKAFVAWVGTTWHQQSMERILEVGLGGQCTPRGRPHNGTTGLCSSSTTMVSPEPFPHRTRSLHCL